jgi:hypothetical protein
MDAGTGFVTQGEDTVASNCGVVAAASLLGTALVALPGAGLEAASTGSEAEPRRIVPPDTTPAQTDRFFHVEWSAGAVDRAGLPPGRGNPAGSLMRR